MTNKTRQKILFIITKSNFGGAQKYVFELAVALKDRGVDVAVACGGTGKKEAGLGLLATKLSEAGITVLPIKHFVRDMSLVDDMRAFFEIKKIIQDQKPDVLHVTSSKAGGIGALAGRILRVPTIVFTSHGLTVDEIWRPFWQRFLIYISTWFTLFLANYSIMISKETFERARNMPGMNEKVVLIKNGVSPVAFLSREDARTALSLTIPHGHILIGGIGELHPNKNWTTAINTISTLPTSVHLAIIGEGEEYEQIQNQIKQLNVAHRIHLLGYVPDAIQYLRAFDIFLLPSKKEGLPYVLLEAGLAGLPVIASDLPGNRDIIESGEQGFLVEPTPQMLSTSIEMLLRDEGMRRRLGLALQQKVTSEFSIERMVDETYALYSMSDLDSNRVVV